MNVNKTITISLSETDVKVIVAQYLNHEGYKVSPEDVKLEVGNEWRGYGMSEHQVPCFKGCSVVLKGETK